MCERARVRCPAREGVDEHLVFRPKLFFGGEDLEAVLETNGLLELLLWCSHGLMHLKMLLLSAIPPCMWSITSEQAREREREGGRRKV